LTKPWLFVLLGLAVHTNPALSQSSNGTLYLIGSTSTSIVVAADSLGVRIAEPPSTNEKLMPLGNTGVCFITGRSVIGSTGDADKLDLNKAVIAWIKEHSKANLPDAYASMDATLLKLMNAHRDRHPKWYSILAKEFSSFTCVGYYMASPQIYLSQYNATPDSITNNTPLNGNRLVPFAAAGQGRVCLEITKGKTTQTLSRFKNEPAVVKYRKAAESKNFASISTNDLLLLSRICLEATESAEGRAFDPDAKYVGPPNRYAVIEDRGGFKWVDPPSRPHQ
jgi:hypothetical protein